MTDNITIIVAVISMFMCLKALKTFYDNKNRDAFMWVLVAFFWTLTALYKSL